MALALAGIISAGLGMSTSENAYAFDPAKVFKEEKPSTKKLFKFYLKKKKQGEEKEALDVLEYAADQGNPAAQWKLGRMYSQGDSVERNDPKAFKFYKQIADRYGEVRPNTPEWAITGKSMVALGHYYRAGIPDAGIPVDENEAQVMFTTAAMYFRDPEGQFELGRFLLEGDASYEEGIQAVRMLKIARSKGHAGAMALLGHSLVEGEYVRQDVVRGLTMLTKALRRSPENMHGWIQELQQEAFALASVEQRRLAIVSIHAEQ